MSAAATTGAGMPEVGLTPPRATVTAAAACRTAAGMNAPRTPIASNSVMIEAVATRASDVMTEAVGVGTRASDVMTEVVGVGTRASDVMTAVMTEAEATRGEER